jgi:hypothetical protein
VASQKQKQLSRRQQPLETFVIGQKEIAAKKQGRKKYLSPSVSDVSTLCETEDKDKTQSITTTLPPTVTGLQIGMSATLRNVMIFYLLQNEVIATIEVLIKVIVNESGGHSTDESKLMQIMETKQKLDKQKKYCQALQDQQIFDAKIKQEKLVKENQNFDFPSLLKHI